MKKKEDEILSDINFILETVISKHEKFLKTFQVFT